MKRNGASCTAFVGLLLLLAGAAWAQVLNEGELGSAAGRRFSFENQPGPPRVVESARQITGIGEVLTRNLKAGASRGTYFGKYTVIRAFDPAATSLLSADILVFGRDAKIDSIRNVQRIVAGYLAAEFGYSEGRADGLAQLVTSYNAAFRGNLAALSQKYTPLVMSNLTAENAGIALSWREWPGRTRLVIPLGRSAVAQGGAAPAQGGATTRQGSTAPAQGGAAPAQGGAITRQGSTAPAQKGGAAPAQSGAAPAPGGAAVRPGSTAPAQGGAAAAPSGAAPAQGGVPPAQSGAAPAPGQAAPAAGASPSSGPAPAATPPAAQGTAVPQPGAAAPAAQPPQRRDAGGFAGALTIVWIVLGVLLVAAAIVLLVILTRWIVRAALRPSWAHMLYLSLREGHPLVEMVVTLQNRHIGLRNVHYLRPGTHASVGGGWSAFLIYFVQVPPRMALLKYDGRNYTFEPVRTELFPDLSGPVPDCLDKEIPARSSRGYRFTIVFHRYVSSLEQINRLMRSIRVPGTRQD